MANVHITKTRCGNCDLLKKHPITKGGYHCPRNRLLIYVAKGFADGCPAFKLKGGATQKK